MNNEGGASCRTLHQPIDTGRVHKLGALPAGGRGPGAPEKALEAVLRDYSGIRPITGHLLTNPFIPTPHSRPTAGSAHRARSTNGVFRNPGGKSGSRGDTDGVEIKAAEMKVDGVAESFAVAEPAR